MSILVFHGRRPFGKHDRTPTQFGEAYVVTVMVHGNWIPVIPKETLLVIPDGRAHPLRVTFRSLAIAYLSVWSVFIFVITLIWAPLHWRSMSVYGKPTAGDILLGIALATVAVASLAWIVFWRSMTGIGRATNKRAAELRALSDQFMLRPPMPENVVTAAMHRKVPEDFDQDDE